MRALTSIQTNIRDLVLRLAPAMLLAVLLTSAAAALVSTNDGFRSNGDLVAGWYWLRDRGLNHYAEYTFANPPTQGDILIDIDALATDSINGRPGVNVMIDLLVGFPGTGRMGGVFHRIRVTLQNMSAPEEQPGYRTHGQVRLDRKILDRVMPVSGELFIRIVRPKATGPHVAFRGDSIRLHKPGGSAGNQAGTGPETAGDSGVDEMRPDLGDRGDEGDCFLDRPCLGDTAAEFRSTGWPGAGNWFWLRAPEAGQYADYRFDKPPTAGDLILDIAVLAQNRPDMTPKDTVHVNLWLGAPESAGTAGRTGPVAIALPSLWTNPDDDVWKARALVRLPREQTDALSGPNKALVLRFERIDAFESDVAFSAGSVLIYSAQDISR
jgi:hypothetical protein